MVCRPPLIYYLYIYKRYERYARRANSPPQLYNKPYNFLHTPLHTYTAQYKGMQVNSLSTCVNIIPKTICYSRSYASSIIFWYSKNPARTPQGGCNVRDFLRAKARVRLSGLLVPSSDVIWNDTKNNHAGSCGSIR